MDLDNYSINLCVDSYDWFVNLSNVNYKKETDQFLIGSKTARYDVLIAWKLLPDFLLQLFL